MKNTRPRPQRFAPAFLIPLLALPLGGADAAAQDPEPPVAPGDTVRVTASGDRAIYEVVRFTSAVLVVREDGALREIPIDALERVELAGRLTRQQQMVADASMLGLVGFVIGAISGHAEGDDPPSEGLGPDFRRPALFKAMIRGIEYAGIGIAPGLLVGAIRPRGRNWIPVDIEPVVVGATPADGGVGLALRWSF